MIEEDWTQNKFDWNGLEDTLVESFLKVMQDKPFKDLLNQSEWDEFYQEFKRRTGKEPKFHQFKGKWDRIKNVWKNIKTLLDRDEGFQWDSVNHRLVATDQVWKSHLLSHPRNKILRNKAYPHFDMLLPYFRSARLYRRLNTLYDDSTMDFRYMSSSMNDDDATVQTNISNAMEGVIDSIAVEPLKKTVVQPQLSTDTLFNANSSESIETENPSFLAMASLIGNPNGQIPAKMLKGSMLFKIVVARLDALPVDRTSYRHVLTTLLDEPAMAQTFVEKRSDADALAFVGHIASS